MDHKIPRPSEVGPIADHLPALISWVGADCHYRWVNNAYEDFFGHPREHIVGKSMREVLGENTWEVIQPYVQRVLAGEAVEYEARLPYQYGGARDVLANYMPHRNASGEVESFFVLVHDVSERKRLEARLKEAEHQVARVLESIAEGYYELDPEWRLRFMNAAAERAAGVDRTEVVGRSVYETFPLFPGSEYEKLFREVLEKQVPASVEMPSLTDPEQFLEVRVYPAGDGLAVFHRDITARKRAEAALRESESRFRNLADAVPQVVWIADPAGRVRYYNERVASFDGVTLTNGAWDWSPMIHPDDLAGTNAAWDAAVSRGEIYEFEHRIRMADGEWRWHLSRAVPVRNSITEETYWYGTATDIHATRSAHEALREADRRKDEFLAILSHELRTPLTAAYGWTRLLRGSALDEDTRGTALEAIEQSLEVQTRLIDELLDLSRITTGKLLLDAQPLDLRTALNDALGSVNLAAQTRRLNLTVDLAAEPLPVLGDAARLQQVVWNILSNAIKFSPEGAQVTVRTRRDGDHALLEISDTGIGIEREFLPLIFQRFTQADSSSTRRWGGLGLGLAIVRHLVELHGGTVEAASDGKGKGATFRVRIPMLRAAQPLERVPEQAKTPHALTGRRVLVVEDEDASRQMIEALLQSAGAEVLSVGNAGAAIDQHLSWRPDVIVADLGMPDIDGNEMLMEIRRRGSRVPAVAVTAYAGEKARADAASAGYGAFVAKPFGPEELVSAVRELLDR